MQRKTQTCPTPNPTLNPGHPSILTHARGRRLLTARAGPENSPLSGLSSLWTHTLLRRLHHTLQVGVRTKQIILQALQTFDRLRSREHLFHSSLVTRQWSDSPSDK